MNIRKILSLCLALIICMGMFTVPAVQAQTDELNLEKLYAFDILDVSENDLSKPVTRIEMVKYTTALLGNKVYSSQSTPYSDVTEENVYSGAVNTAYALGIISPAALFYPDRTVKYQEAVKMLVTALGYADAAENRGGYHGGYVAVAMELGLLKNVNAKENDGLTLITVAQLLENALNTKVCNNSYVIDKPGELKSVYNSLSENQTVLNLYLKTSKYRVFVTELSSSIMKAELINKDENNKYQIGDTLNLTVSENASLDDCLYTYSYIYVNDDDEVVYAETDKRIEIKTGYIHEVNESDSTAPYAYDAIESIALEDGDDYIEIPQNCKMIFDSKEAQTNKLYYVAGSFARVVLYNDEVIALQSWKLKEGGIITKVEENSLEYTKGEIPGAILSDISAYDSVSIYINGIKSEKWAMVPDALFDWYAADDKSELIISVSTRIITEKLNGLSDEGLMVGDDTYPLSKLYDMYYSEKGEMYYKAGNYDALYGGMVDVYLDAAGYVRYLTVAKDELNNEFYALIIGREQKEYENLKLKLYTFENGEVVEKVYEVAEGLVKRQKPIIDKIIADCTSIATAAAGNKNTALMNAELIYKLKLNSSGVITSIKKADKFSETILNQKWAKGETGFSVSTFTTSTNQYIDNPRVYLDDSLFCVCYYTEGKFVVKLVGWEMFRAKTASGLWMTPYGEIGSSDVDIMLVRGDIDSLNPRTENVLSGLCTDITVGYDKENEKEILKLKLDGNSYIVSKYKDMFAGVKEAAYITYSKSDGNPLLEDNEIKPISVTNLSGSPDTWEITGKIEDGKVTEGIFKDEIKKIDDKRIFFESGAVWYTSSNVRYFEIVEKNGSVKHLSRAKTEVENGAEVWYILKNKEVRTVFFR